jgi:hypothetical protein
MLELRGEAQTTHRQRWGLVHGPLAFYHWWMPRPTPLAVLVKVVGRRWTVEERIQTSKGLCGLDQHQVPPLALLVPLGDPGDAGWLTPSWWSRP